MPTRLSETRPPDKVAGEQGEEENKGADEQGKRENQVSKKTAKLEENGVYVGELLWHDGGSTKCIMDPTADV